MKNGIKKLAVLFILGLCSFGLFACDKNTPSPEIPPEPSGEKTFTIKWVDHDGNVLEVDDNVKAGQMPEYNSAKPTKASDSNYQYKFRNWYPVVVPASANVTYVADYAPVKIGAKKNWYLESVEWVMQNKTKLLGGVTGGSAICTTFDKLFAFLGVDQLESVDPLEEIKGKIDDLQSSVNEGFANVEQLIMNSVAGLSADMKSAINQSERNIEAMVLSQTAIANKGDSFDSLLSAMKSTDRSLEAILNDQTMSKQDRALSIARLIGSYDKWNDSGNLFASYLSFLDAITKSSYSTTNDKILFDLVYDQQMLYSTFTTEAISTGAPYVEKIMYLAFYAYSIISECISAATTVANFTAEDINNLSEANKALYPSVVSPFSVIQIQTDFLNSKLCETGFSDVSVMDRFIEYFDRTRRGGIIFKLSNSSQVKISDSLTVQNFNSDNYKNCYGASDDLAEFWDERVFYDFSDSLVLVNHIKTFYNGMTIREFLTLLGYDMTNVPTGAYYMVGMDIDPPTFSHASYSGISIDDPTYITHNVVVYQGSTKTNSWAVTFKSI